MWNKVHANDIILICDVAVAKSSFKKEFLVLHKRQCFLFQMLYKYGICRWFLREKTNVLCCIFTFWMIEFKLGNVFKDKIWGMENSSRVSELRKKWDRKLCMLLILFFHDYFTVDRIDNGTSQHVSFELQTDIPSHMEPPPSYESIMSRSNEAFQSTESLPTSSLALNKDSREVIETPPEYATVTSQYNNNLQSSQSDVLSNEFSQTNHV